MPRIMPHAITTAISRYRPARRAWGCITSLTGGTVGSRPDKQVFPGLHGPRKVPLAEPAQALVCAASSFIFELSRESMRAFSPSRNHPGDEANRNDGQGASDGFLRFEGEGFRSEGQQSAKAEGQQDRHTDAGPHGCQQVSALRFADVVKAEYRQCCFEAFTQTNQKVSEEGSQSSSQYHQLNSFSCLINIR